MKPTKLAPLSSEYIYADLGDKRLSNRLNKIVDAAGKAPSASLPKQSGSSASLEGAYRFIENDKVNPEEIMNSHVKCTVERASKYPHVYIAHDTSQFVFGGDSKRNGLGRINSEKTQQGFLAHYSICISPDGEPLGTVGLYAWSRSQEIKGRRSQSASQLDLDRESLRWIDAAIQTGELLYEKTSAIHLMDREGDSYELFAFLLDNKQRFVIRVSHDRKKEPGRSKSIAPKLFESLSKSPFYFNREVILSARKKAITAKRERTFPMRERRITQLEVRASNQEIFIGNGAPAHLPASLNLNFVEVREVNPPENCEPVVWRIVTTEPIETEAQVAAIVDAYRKRWLIEEFFKALKTGCNYQKHQAESAKVLLVLLAIETAVAWRMLVTRWMAHNHPDAPASSIINELQIRILLAIAKQQKKNIPEPMTASHVLFEIAALGGHIKNNGPPGWLILRRGFEELLTMERGFQLAMNLNTLKDEINH
jgi:hypothetical protein